MGSREQVFMEFEQLLNLLYSSNPAHSPWRWKRAPFTAAIERFLIDASATISTRELRRYATGAWLSRRHWPNKPDIRRSLDELLDTTFSHRRTANAS